MLQEGPRAHDLVLVGTPKAYSGTEPDIVMESISDIDPAYVMSVSAIAIWTKPLARRTLSRVRRAAVCVG